MRSITMSSALPGSEMASQAQGSSSSTLVKAFIRAIELTPASSRSPKMAPIAIRNFFMPPSISNSPYNRITAESARR